MNTAKPSKLGKQSWIYINKTTYEDWQIKNTVGNYVKATNQRKETEMVNTLNKT